MRDNPDSAVYNRAYINERVRFDVQSAVPECPSADGVLRMLTHEPHARSPIYTVQGAGVETSSLEEYRADYFRRRPTEDIERQNCGQEEDEYIDLIRTCITDITLQDAVDRRIEIVELMQALCAYRDIQSGFYHKSFK
ncbi:hypothetical protein DL95DRAFT_468460 [Leptodontidium sp. 2 PMI_412]|nr:hypothetical protein DL95DRAFT_468460 [Leptodontidium sp. 2 PMI_412]